MEMIIDTDVAQCSMANSAFEHDDGRCCIDGGRADCDLPLKVRKISSEWDRYGKHAIFSDGTLTEADTIEALEQGSPVEIGILWNGGGGHAVLIVGYEIEDGVSLFTVFDPLEGTFIGGYDDVMTAFGSGAWTWSWVVEQPFEGA